MDMKEKLLAEMEQSDFAKNNGKIMRTLNVLAPSYHNLSSIQRILKDDGIGEGQYAACLDFLALEGYILLRTVKDHVRCEDLADHNWTELEAKLSGKVIGLFGSYGWGDGEWMRNWEETCLGDGAVFAGDSVICNEAPDDEADAACIALGKKLAGE